MEIWSDVTIAGQTTNRTKRKDRATQPLDHGRLRWAKTHELKSTTTTTTRVATGSAVVHNTYPSHGCNTAEAGRVRYEHTPSNPRLIIIIIFITRTYSIKSPTLSSMTSTSSIFCVVRFIEQFTLEDPSTREKEAG